MSIAEKFEVIADEVYEKGVLDSKKAFENAITINGRRISYNRAFSNTDYSGYEFSHPIKPLNDITQMFYACETMTELPKPLDFSEILTTCNDAYGNRRGVFGYCRKLKVIPDLNMRAIGGLEEWFSYCESLETIELLRVNENTIYAPSNSYSFYGCKQLQNITFDGVIGQDISFANSPLLTDASLDSIVSHLKDYSIGWVEGDGNKATITLHSTVKERIKNTEIENLIKSKKWGIA